MRTRVRQEAKNNQPLLRHLLRHRRACVSRPHFAGSGKGLQDETGADAANHEDDWRQQPQNRYCHRRSLRPM
jgi:hypothetical protein